MQSLVFLTYGFKRDRKKSFGDSLDALLVKGRLRPRAHLYEISLEKPDPVFIKNIEVVNI